MKKKTFILIITLLLLSALTMAACQTRTSDSGFSLTTVGKRIDSNIYLLNVTMLNPATSNKNLGGEGSARQYSDVYGYGNMRIWQDGKGLVSVHVNSISPNPGYVHAGMDVVLKTTDLKIMAIMPGYSFNVKCRNDYEPVASLQDNEMTSERYDTYELDYCRMSNPEIVLDEAYIQ